MKMETMTPKHAIEMMNWIYERPHDFYNMKNDKVDHKKWIKQIRDNDFPHEYAVIEDDSLFGDYSFEVVDKILIYGLGIAPQNTGKGLGKEFVLLRICHYNMVSGGE